MDSLAIDLAQRLDTAIKSVGPMVVAFSGGVDSSLLAVAATKSLPPESLLAVTADSSSFATGEKQQCQQLTDAWGISWQTVATNELNDPRYQANSSDRCFWCKTALMNELEPIATSRSATVVLGVNLDDLGDHRPGQSAAQERGAKFPLVDAGFTKSDVRHLAKSWGVEVWDRPAMPCLASRIPYGTEVTLTLLSKVDRAEAALRNLGFGDIRVRHYGDTARVEVPANEIAAIGEQSEAIDKALKKIGYRYVTLDLGGLRSGNLNLAINDDAPQARIDLERSERIDLPEAVYCESKTVEQCVQIIGDMLDRGDDSVIATRTTPEQLAALRELNPQSQAGRTLTWRHRPPTNLSVAIVAAGTSDLPVSSEAQLTLAAMGHSPTTLTDVGVAGLHRLIATLPELEKSDVIIAIAGMEGSLPTVLAGLVKQPIIAVPTSVGYGSSFDGVTATLSMMASCAPGISVVGIDNGYGAACAAHRILGAIK